jgi:hypothetical protein
MNGIGPALFLLMAAGATVAAADVGIIDRPQACSHVLTVQQRGCEMQKIFRCVGGAGIYFRSERIDEFGLVDIMHMDAGGNPLELTSYEV